MPPAPYKSRKLPIDWIRSVERDSRMDIGGNMLHLSRGILSGCHYAPYTLEKSELFAASILLQCKKE